MTASAPKPLFGLIGGMGPLSSAQFINTVYRNCSSKFGVEQEYPRLIVLSDPTIPDRTKAMREKQTHLVTSIFERRIEELISMGADEIMIACLAAHLLLDKIPIRLTEKITSILKLLYNELDTSTGNNLILSSMALYEHKLIQHKRAIYPSIDDVILVQDFISCIKVNYSSKLMNRFVHLVNNLTKKYKANSVIFACTELHLANDFIKTHSSEVYCNIIDPLEIAANYIINKT